MAGSRADQDRINDFLAERNLHPLDPVSVDIIFDQLDHLLHHSIRQLPGSDPTILPQVICQKGGRFLLNVPARNTPLEVVVFGTISNEIYLDMVWEAIQTAPEYNRGSGILEVEKLPELKFLIRFKGLDFQWTYHCENELVRRYGKALLQVPDRTLEIICGTSIRKKISRLAQLSTLQQKIKIEPNFARNFSICRAWAVLKGNMRSDIDLHIGEALARSSATGSLEIDPALKTFLDMTASNTTAGFDIKECLRALTDLEQAPLESKLQTKYYLTIRVIHSNCSDTLASVWLRYVESRLPGLSKSITTSLKGREPISWPGRLVHKDVEVNPSTYEGFYIIGINMNETLETMEVWDAFVKWRKTIQMHESTIPECFLTGRLSLSLEFAEWELRSGGLKRCLRILTPTFLTAPKPLETDNASTVKKSPKNGRPKRGNGTSQQPSCKLRRAQDIHSRLQYDQQFNIDEYWIGYKDRFSEAIVEMRARSWIRETTHESFIPESRIWYFKRVVENGAGGGGEGEIVWDRERKIDKIFGSGVKDGETEEEEENGETTMDEGVAGIEARLASAALV